MPYTSTLSTPDLARPSSAPSDETKPYKARSPAVMWLITLLVMVPIFIAAGALSALALYGAREWVWSKREVEAEQTVSAIAGGLTRCAAFQTNSRAAGLPETSPKIPAHLTAVSRSPYQSNALEWAAPAFACAGYARSNSQRFQYQWVRTSPDRGTVWAHADKDGDGSVDLSIASDVDCSAGLERCVASEPHEATP